VLTEFLLNSNLKTGGYQTYSVETPLGYVGLRHWTFDLLLFVRIGKSVGPLKFGKPEQSNRAGGADTKALTNRYT